ncbi:hypothetical protein OIV83_001878 [Microbotryomycetes sp. JL201]|nr:hypothetical protein OIV83_001878 [Microbotryomycetes sp. JL201]
MNVPYVESPALSPRHYKLVRAVENAGNDEIRLSVLVDHLQGIRSKFGSKAKSTSSTKHDLLLALYSRSQRPQRLPVELEELFSLEWCLPRAIKLAGGSESELSSRATGYRVCDEVFTCHPHILKLLLVNTIRADLEAETGSPRHMARWILGLRAAASPRLATSDLAPAVADRILYLFQRHPSPSLRRLALAALVHLRKWISPQMIRECQRTIEAFLSATPNELAKAQSAALIEGERDPGLLAALVRAFPAFCLGKMTSAHASAALNLSLLLDSGDMGQALQIDVFMALGALPLAVFQKVSEARQQDLCDALAVVAKKLGSNVLSERFWAIKSLTALPVDLWADKSEADGWGEPVWTRLLKGLSDPDASIRRQSLRLVGKVDNELVKTHIENLLARLKPSTKGDKGIVQNRLISLLLEAVFTHYENDGAALATAFARSVLIVRDNEHTAIVQAILHVVDRFEWWESRYLGQFAREMMSKEWKSDLTLATVFAAVAGQGTDETNNATGREAISDMLTWIQQTRDETLLERLQEPFVLSILRIISQDMDMNVNQFVDGVKLASKRATLSAQPLFDLLQQSLQEGAVRRALLSVGKTGKRLTLSTFFASFKVALANPIEDDHLNGDTRSSTVDSRSSIESAALEPQTKPLKYDPYTSPSSASVYSPRGRTTAEEQHRRLEKELARERKIRGGRGGVGESVMLVNAGELALLHAEGNPDSEASESDQDEEGSTPVQGSQQRDAQEDSIIDSRSRRDSSCSSRRTDEDLLTEMEELDPFRT